MINHLDGETIEITAVVKDKAERGFSIQKKHLSTQLEPNEVLIRVINASFCGTDYHIYAYDDWAKNRLKLPLTVGHEFCGRIVKIGSSVTNVTIGDIVSAETHIICGECEFCLRGEGHICERTKIIGVDTDGCFADYIKIPASNCFINSRNVDPLYLSIQEPLGNAVHTMSHFNIKGKCVVILGCGPIGLLAIDVAKAYGAKKIIAIETKEYRRNLAASLHADVVINPLEEDVVMRVMEETNHRGADVIGEFSGNKTAIEQAFEYIKPGGGMSFLGLPSQKIEIDFSKNLVAKGISIYGVTGRRIYDTWNEVKYLIDNNKLNLTKVITHIFTLDQVNFAGELMGRGECGKIVLTVER